MKFACSASPISADILFLLFKKDEKLSTAIKSALGAKATKQVEAHLKSKDFEGDEGQVLTLFPENSKWKRIVLLGRGEKEVPQSLEFLGAKIPDIGKAAKAKSITVWIDEKDLAQLAYGLVAGAYEFKYYKTTDKKSVALETINFVSTNKELLRSLEIFEKTSTTVRDLTNTCAGDLNPTEIAEEAKKIAKKYKMKVTILDTKKLEQLGCGAIIGVGQGAKTGPCMVFLEYRHESKAKEPNVAFIGKGLIFDSGGLNLKPTGHIETMKQDMAGAATVLGTIEALAEAKVKGYFLAVLVCAENAISDKAIHPGDVIKSYNGKTIEVNNTDAEGRLVLADAMAYTEKNYKPKVMIDIATLTGAVTVALGYNITGVIANDEKLLDEVLKAGKKVYERLWPLPLDEDFVKLTKGDFCDLKNATDGVRAGTIMGAAFLKNFVDKTPWVHFDIGGTAWADKPTASTKYGSTAAGLRTLIEIGKHYAA